MRVGNHVFERYRATEDEYCYVVDVLVRQKDIDEIADSLLNLNKDNELFSSILIG
jgi:hypothetical protein